MQPAVPAESAIIVHNIAKRHNVGTLARSATAFGVSEMILVGRRDFNSFGSHGSTSHLRFRHFASLSLARSYFKGRDFDICGVEIVDGAASVSDHPFRKSTAFLLGNEGTGLSEKECEMCDFFVYIPQYGCGTASLNVTVAASIVLHHFGASSSSDLVWVPFFIDLISISLINIIYNLGQQCIFVTTPKVYYLVWAGFPERSREGNKFAVAERPVKQVRRNYCAESLESVIKERKNRREFAGNDILEEQSAPDGSQPSNFLEALFEC